MVEYYIKNGNRIEKTDKIVSGAWVYAVDPSEGEIFSLSDALDIDPDFVRAALDEEERSRIEIDDDSSTVLILADAPIAEKDGKATVTYSTIPVGMIFAKENLVTVCLKDNTVLKDIAEGCVKNVNPSFRSRMCLQIMMQMASKYMQYLRKIDKITDNIEKQLHKATTTNELVQMLDLQKSLVYISTSLKNTEMTLSKIERGRVIKMYEEDRELLEDVIVEYKQAREMAEIFNSVLTSTIDTFSTVISNNLNETMKKLTSITILIAIPTMVAGFYGMNINMEGLPLSENFWVLLALSALITGIVAFILYKKKML